MFLVSYLRIQCKIQDQEDLPHDFPGGSDGKASAYNAGEPGSIPGLGRSSGEGNGNPLQYSCLDNSMDREAWQATVHRIAQSRTGLNQLSTYVQEI